MEFFSGINKYFKIGYNLFLRNHGNISEYYKASNLKDQMHYNASKF